MISGVIRTTPAAAPAQPTRPKPAAAPIAPPRGAYVKPEEICKWDTIRYRSPPRPGRTFETMCPYTPVKRGDVRDMGGGNLRWTTTWHGNEEGPLECSCMRK